jgi:hypothetical protein
LPLRQVLLKTIRKEANVLKLSAVALKKDRKV